MADPSSSSGQLRCLVVTPESTVLDTEAQLVSVPLFDGEFGILPGKSPMIGRLGFGQLRLKTAQGTQRFYVDGGFVQVRDNLVSVLTARSLPVDRLDAKSAAAQLEDARTRKPSSPEEFAIRDRLLSQARAQLRMAGDK